MSRLILNVWFVVMLVLGFLVGSGILYPCPKWQSYVCFLSGFLIVFLISPISFRKYFKQVGFFHVLKGMVILSATYGIFYSYYYYLLVQVWDVDLFSFSYIAPLCLIAVVMLYVVLELLSSLFKRIAIRPRPKKEPFPTFDKDAYSKKPA